MILDKTPDGIVQTAETQDDKLIIKTYQDVQPILERNKKLQSADEYKRQGIKNDYQHVASIPLVLVHEWMKQGINIWDKADWPKIKAKLQEPENRYLRTTLGDI